MPSIREQLLAIFAADEPEYERAVALGAAALPALGKMADDGDPHLAAAAVYVAGQIPTRDALEVIARAARRHDPVVRATAAGALRDWAMHPECADELDAAAEIVAPLLEDENATVRRFARDAIDVLPAHHPHA
jgi:HEAT repeat protein